MQFENVKVLEKLQQRSGTSTNGDWKVQGYIVEETTGNYPQKYEVEFFGDKADACALNVGEVVTIDFDIRSREYNNRLYYSLRGWKVTRAENAPVAQAPSAQPMPAPVIPQPASSSQLPF